MKLNHLIERLNYGLYKAQFRASSRRINSRYIRL